MSEEEPRSTPCATRFKNVAAAGSPGVARAGLQNLTVIGLLDGDSGRLNSEVGRGLQESGILAGRDFSISCGFAWPKHEANPVAMTDVWTVQGAKLINSSSHPWPCGRGRFASGGIVGNDVRFLCQSQLAKTRHVPANRKASLHSFMLRPFTVVPEEPKAVLSGVFLVRRAGHVSLASQLVGCSPPPCGLARSSSTVFRTVSQLPTPLARSVIDAI